MSNVAELLEATLDEEKLTDAKLSELADSEINVEAEETEGEKEKPRRSAGGRRR